MRIEPRRLRIAGLSVVAGALLLAAGPSPSLGQVAVDSRSSCAAITDAKVQHNAEQTTPALTRFPVVVHYMKHRSEGSGPDSAVRGIFPVNRLIDLFAEDGDFNRVWWKKHRKVMFVLVAVETCTYRGDPVPLVSTALMRKLGDALNLRELKMANGVQPFQGLDLYLWAGLDGNGTVAGFARSAAAMKHPSVWLSTDCSQRGGSICTSKFGHEVGHFFGLCHLCALDPVGSPETNPATCRQTCPAAGRAGTRLPACRDTDADRLMADQDGIELEPCELSFAVGNAATILTPAVH